MAEVNHYKITSSFKHLLKFEVRPKYNPRLCRKDFLKMNFDLCLEERVKK